MQKLLDMIIVTKTNAIIRSTFMSRQAEKRLVKIVLSFCGDGGLNCTKSFKICPNEYFSQGD